MKKELKLNILYGSFWGIAEATIGYILHWIFFPISGMIMFPIGVYFMKRAENESGKASSIFYVSLVAAFIKAFNLFMPNSSIFKVINPIFMILAQGLLVLVFLSKNSVVNIKSILASSVLWRVGFILILLIEFRSVDKIYHLNGGAFRLINFIVINSLINSLIIAVMSKIGFKRSLKLDGNLSFLVLFMAIGIQFIL